MRIGVIGGGQLGRMMATAATPLGIHMAFLDPNKGACAGDVGLLVEGAYDDHYEIRELIKHSDRITFEFENVPPETVEFIADQVPVYPSALALETARDRWLEKKPVSTIGHRHRTGRGHRQPGRLGSGGRAYTVTRCAEDTDHGIRRQGPKDPAYVR